MPKTFSSLKPLFLAKLPDLTAEQADKYIQILRERNQGKLSGLSVVDIKKGVEELWKKDTGAVGGAAGAVGAVGFGRGRQIGGQFGGRSAQSAPAEEEEAECSICLEPVSPNDANYKELNPCKHGFHLNCITVSFGSVSTVLTLIVNIYRTGSIPRELAATPVQTAGTTLWM